MRSSNLIVGCDVLKYVYNLFFCIYTSVLFCGVFVNVIYLFPKLMLWRMFRYIFSSYCCFTIIM